jgi:hypothetical protein
MAPSAHEGTQAPQPSHNSSSILMIFRFAFILQSFSSTFLDSDITPLLR